MDVKHSINEAYRQLNSKDKDPKTTNAKLVNYTIQRFKKEKSLNENIPNALKGSNPKTPKCFMLPKIYKKDYPVRPVAT